MVTRKHFTIKRSKRAGVFAGLRCLAVMVSLSLVLLGCDRQEAQDEALTSSSQTDVSSLATDTVSSSIEPTVAVSPVATIVYFSDAAGLKLVGETRTLQSGEDLPAALVQALIDGPTAPNQPTLPPGTRLLGVTVEKGEAIVDLSQEFVDNHPGGSSSERLSVYSIVNTLAGLPEIDQVTIVVNGKNIEAIGGHLDLSGPLARDGSIL